MEKVKRIITTIGKCMDWVYNTMCATIGTIVKATVVTGRAIQIAAIIGRNIYNGVEKRVDRGDLLIVIAILGITHITGLTTEGGIITIIGLGTLLALKNILEELTMGTHSYWDEKQKQVAITYYKPVKNQSKAGYYIHGYDNVEVEVIKRKDAKKALTLDVVVQAEGEVIGKKVVKTQNTKPQQNQAKPQQAKAKPQQNQTKPQQAQPKALPVKVVKPQQNPMSAPPGTSVVDVKTVEAEIAENQKLINDHEVTNPIIGRVMSSVPAEIKNKIKQRADELMNQDPTKKWVADDKETQKALDQLRKKLKSLYMREAILELDADGDIDLGEYEN